jgi:hypothetical protein
LWPAWQLNYGPVGTFGLVSLSLYDRPVYLSTLRAASIVSKPSRRAMPNGRRFFFTAALYPLTSPGRRLHPRDIVGPAHRRAGGALQGRLRLLSQQPPTRISRLSGARIPSKLLKARYARWQSTRYAGRQTRLSSAPCYRGAPGRVRSSAPGNRSAWRLPNGLAEHIRLPPLPVCRRPFFLCRCGVP